MGRKNPTESTIRRGYSKFEWITLAELSEYTGLTVSTLYKHSRAGGKYITRTPSPYKVFFPAARAYFHPDEKKDTRVLPRDLFTKLEMAANG